MPLLSQEEKLSLLSLLFSVVFVVFSFFKMFIILFVGLRLGGNLLRIHSCKELRRCHYFNSASLIVFLISGDDTVGQLINSRAVLGSILIVFPNVCVNICSHHLSYFSLTSASIPRSSTGTGVPPCTDKFLTKSMAASRLPWTVAGRRIGRAWRRKRLT